MLGGWEATRKLWITWKTMDNIPLSDANAEAVPDGILTPHVSWASELQMMQTMMPNQLGAAAGHVFHIKQKAPSLACRLALPRRKPCHPFRTSTWMCYLKAQFFHQLCCCAWVKALHMSFIEHLLPWILHKSCSRHRLAIQPAAGSAC